MAKTYHPIDAIKYAKAFIKGMPIDRPETALSILNAAHIYIWKYASWVWTVGTMDTFSVASDTQDYTVNIPSDFTYAFGATLVDSDSGKMSPYVELEVVSHLPTDVGLVGTPKKVAFSGTAGLVGTARISPKPGTNIGGTSYVVSQYKRTPTLYTPQTIFTGTMPFDDVYFDVFSEGVLWRAYKFADDRRAGEANIDPKTGKWAFSGQRAEFETGLQLMVEREPLIIASPFRIEQKEKK